MKTLVAFILIFAVVIFVVTYKDNSDGSYYSFDVEDWLADTEALNDDFKLIEKLREAWNGVKVNDDSPEWLKPMKYVQVTFETIGSWFNWMVTFTDLLTPWNYIKKLDQYDIWGVSQ